MGEPHQMATWSATFVSWGQNTINPTAWLRAQIQQRSATILRFHTESDSPWLSRQRSDRMLKKTLTPINWELWPWKLCSVETSASFQTELNGTFFEPPVAKASLLVHESTSIHSHIYILYIIYYILYIIYYIYACICFIYNCRLWKGDFTTSGVRRWHGPLWGAESSAGEAPGQYFNWWPAPWNLWDF